MGLELSFERLRRMRRLVFGLGLAQVVVTMLILSGVAWALGLAPPSALTVGAALDDVLDRDRHPGAGREQAAPRRRRPGELRGAAVSGSRGRAAAGHGGRILGRRRARTWAGRWSARLAPAALALAALIVFGRLALRPFFHFVAETKSPEFFMAACLLVVLGDGLAAAASHLSMALGAFVAGLLLAETEYRREIEVTIEPFQGLAARALFRLGRGRDQSGASSSPGPASSSASPRRWSALKGLILFGAGAGLPAAASRSAPKWRCCSGRAASSAS